MNQFLKETIPYVLILFVVILLKTYVVSPIRVNQESMYPTLYDQDIMLLNKFVYRFNEINRFDIVVIQTSDERIIKRVIGLPGEKIEYRDNQLYVDGKAVKENFSHAEITDYNIEELGSITVPKDSYFVLGDNRTVSIDSRILGFISKEKILGKAKYILFPINRFRNTEKTSK